jgi:hypothetical protein
MNIEDYLGSVKKIFVLLLTDYKDYSSKQMKIKSKTNTISILCFVFYSIQLYSQCDVHINELSFTINQINNTFTYSWSGCDPCEFDINGDPDIMDVCACIDNCPNLDFED